MKHVMFQFYPAVLGFAVSFTQFFAAQFSLPVISPKFHLIFRLVTGEQLLTVVTVL